MNERGKLSIFHMGICLSVFALGGKYGWQYGYSLGGMRRCAEQMWELPLFCTVGVTRHAADAHQIAHHHFLN